MSEAIEIHWTTGSLDEARKVCRALVEGKLVACAQITPWIESIYLWNGQLETTQESKVILKTNTSHAEAVRTFILKNTTYEVPEILIFPIAGGHPEYLAWLQNQLS